MFSIENPLLWGLPETRKLKAFWLCGRCCRRLSIRLDLVAYRIRLIPKQVHPRQQATIA